MKLSIRSRLLLMGIIVAVISAAIFGWLNIRHEEKALSEELNERANSLTRNLAMNAEYGLLSSNREELQRLSNNILSQKDIYSVRIEDKKGKTLVKVAKSAKSEPVREYFAPVTVERRADSAKEGMLLEYGEEMETETIGKVEVRMSLVSFYEKLDELRGTVAVNILVIILIVTFGVVFTVNRYIGNPIRDLISATQKISQGNLDHRIPVRTKDEIGVLADFFNKMTEELKRSRGRIEDYNKNLEQKVAERTRALEEANEKLKEMDRLKAGFLSNVSHELRTPLTSIKGFVDTIIKDPDMDPKTRGEFLLNVKEDSNKLAWLISRLINLSRIESGTMKIGMKKVDLVTIVREVVGSWETEARSKQLSLVVDLPVAPAMITVDPDKIKEAVNQLIDNSVRALRAEGKITVAVREQPDGVMVSVVDNGIGIPKADLPHIFEKFHKIERPAEQVGGIGMGLTLVKYIVDAHGGRIWAVSEEGKGSTFVFVLPKITRESEQADL
jgi:signal transduction histidine kinase